MDSSTAWLHRLAEALGPTETPRRLSDAAWSIRAGGRRLVAKVGPGAADEAAGLAELAAVAGGPPVPEVVLVDADLLVTVWIDQTDRSPALEEELGRRLARLHGAPRAAWGGGSRWVGACPVDAAAAGSASEFYGRRLRELARRCGLADEIEPVVFRLPWLIPPSPPSPVHGDLWWGNVLWGGDGRPWVIDPSVHGGHPEEDLAMLGLFGSVPGRLLAAYREVRPLDDGFEERLDLFRLVPLLVHAVLFGGSYRGQAVVAARRYS